MGQQKNNIEQTKTHLAQQNFTFKYGPAGILFGPIDFFFLNATPSATFVLEIIQLFSFQTKIVNKQIKISICVLLKRRMWNIY